MLTLYPAESYDSLVSLEDADAYWLAMDDASWDLNTEQQREAALRRGTQYVMALRPTSAALTVMPYNLKAAVCEAAIRHISGELYKDVEPQAVVSEAVGPIRTVYAQPVNTGRKRFTVIDDLLRGLVQGASMVRVERA